MRIINHNKNITVGQIREAINLLPEDYHDKDFVIVIYGNESLSRDTNPNNCPAGKCDLNKNKISIFPYRIPEKHRNIDNIIKVLYHELRHSYQYKYFPGLFYNQNNMAIAERDAMNFTKEMCFIWKHPSKASYNTNMKHYNDRIVFDTLAK